MIVVAEAVATNAAAIAIWLMMCARLGRPLVGMFVNVTFGKDPWSICILFLGRWSSSWQISCEKFATPVPLQQTISTNWEHGILHESDACRRGLIHM